jgi:hypothetical protein
LSDVSENCAEKHEFGKNNVLSRDLTFFVSFVGHGGPLGPAWPGKAWISIGNSYDSQVRKKEQKAHLAAQGPHQVNPGGHLGGQKSVFSHSRGKSMVANTQPPVVFERFQRKMH